MAKAPDPIPRTYYGQPRPPEAAVHRPETLAAVRAHVERWIGPVTAVQPDPDPVWVDTSVLVAAAQPDRPYHALVTAGMSERPMAIPADVADEVPPYAELMIALPPDWPVDRLGATDPDYGWPAWWLRYLVQFVHAHDSWFGWWHWIPNGTPPVPLAPSVPFTGVVLMPTIEPEDEFRHLVIDDGREVRISAVVPLLPDELDLKLTAGIDALIPGFEAHGVSEVLDPRRTSVLAQPG